MNISHITYQLSQQTKTVYELSEHGEFSRAEAKVFDKLMGLKNIPRNDLSSHLQQLMSVLDHFVNEISFNPSDVKYIFYAHTADYTSPSNINILQEIKTNFYFKNALCVGSSFLKCASAFQFVQMSNALFLNMNDDDTILILIGDLAFTNILRYIPGSTVLGDAATALLLCKHSLYHQFIDSEFKCDGRFSGGMWGDHDEQLLFQAIYVETLCHIITEISERNQLDLSHIKCIFPHNVNSISWRQVMNALGLSSNQIYLHNIARTGHCFGSDPFINLKDGIVNNNISMGDHYMLVTVGLGAVFSALLFKY